MRRLHQVVWSALGWSMMMMVGSSPCIQAAIYGTTGTPLSLPPASDLFVFNETTGCGTYIGPIKIDDRFPVLVNGLVYDYTNGKLYATTDSASQSNPRTLITIDPYTGIATLVGSLGTGLCCPAINSTGQMFAFREATSDMYYVDKTTAASRFLNTSGTGLARLGLSFDDQDQLHMIQSLSAISGGLNRHLVVSTTNGTAIRVAEFEVRDKTFIFNAEPRIAPITKFPTIHGFIMPGTRLFYSVEFIYDPVEGDYNSDGRRGNRIKIYHLDYHNISAVMETSVSPLLTLAHTDFDVEPCELVACGVGQIYMYEFTRTNSKPAGVPQACFEACVDDVPKTVDRRRSLGYCCGRCNKRLLG